jgi:hypothetical protein
VLEVLLDAFEPARHVEAVLDALVEGVAERHAPASRRVAVEAADRHEDRAGAVLPQMVEAAFEADRAEVRDERRRVQRVGVDHALRQEAEAVGQVRRAHREPDQRHGQLEQEVHLVVRGGLLARAAGGELVVDRVGHLGERLLVLEALLHRDHGRLVVEGLLRAERHPDAVALPHAPARHEAVDARPLVHLLHDRAQHHVEERDRPLRGAALVQPLEELERGLGVDLLRIEEDRVVPARRDEGHEAADGRQVADELSVGAAAEHVRGPRSGGSA